MRMGIKKNHFTLLPAGMLTNGTSNLPSLLAAKIIPLDSIHINFIGFKFDTKITHLPIKSSGL